MEGVNHLSLFSGIGGLDLASEWAGMKTVGQVEWVDFPTKVLEKHWPNIPRWRDVRDVTGESIRRKCGKIDIISGGFPCQPHSLAGKREASTDERDLWGEFARIISEVKPQWVVGENVPGLLSSESGRFFRRILRDFAQMGYDVGWCTYGAYEVGAIHRRERIFIVAHTNRFNVERGSIKKVLGEFTLPSELPYGSVEEWTRRQKIFEPKLCRTFNGIPGTVDRIMSLGNAVVPLQAYPLFKTIMELGGGGDN